MANARRAIEIYLTIAAIEADSGPMVSHYAVPLDYPRLYKWWIANTSTVDHVTVLGHTGGTAGRWLQVRCDDRGANLTDADATIGVDGKPVRYLPAATALELDARQSHALWRTWHCALPHARGVLEAHRLLCSCA
jgi:hypothetical protein